MRNFRAKTDKYTTEDDLEFLEEEDFAEDIDEFSEEVVDESFIDDLKEEHEITALDCFGWKKEKTENWLLKCANVWYMIISFGWFIFGAMTFAPVIFISSKVNVIFKDKKKSFIFAASVQAAILVLFGILLFKRR
jgi:hypothetical protein